MGLAWVAESTFSFYCGSVCTDQIYIKHFVLCCAIIFVAKENVREAIFNLMFVAQKRNN